MRSRDESESVNEFDLLQGDDDILALEPQPLCVALNSSGSRVAVGGSNGFRVFALRHDEKIPAASSSTVRFVETLRYPSLSNRDPRLEESDASSDLFAEFDVANTSRQANGKALSSSSFAKPACGVGSIALLAETSTVAVSGGGAAPIAPLNKILIYIGTSLNHDVALRDAIRRLVATPRFLVALTRTTLDIVTFSGQCLYSCAAQGGALEASPGPLAIHFTQRLIAFSTSVPASDVASVRVLVYPDDQLFACGVPDENDFPVVSEIPQAHAHNVTSMSLNFDGQLLATGSERGTLIRVWKIGSSQGVLLKELRSASVASPLSQLCFIGNQYLAGLCGAKVKVFFVGDEETVVDATRQEVEFWENHKEKTALAKNQSSAFASLSYVCNYFGSKWAVAECDLPLPHFAPACMSIKQSSTPLTDSPAVASAPQGTSSWLGYLGSWVGTGTASSATPAATKPASTSPSSAASAAFYAPSNLEDLCALWWENPLSKYLVQADVAPLDGTRTRAPSVNASAASGSSQINHVCFFNCVNSDGKLLRFQFDAVRGIITVVSRADPISLKK